MSSIRASDKKATEPVGLARWAKEQLLLQNRTQKCHAPDTGKLLPACMLPALPQSTGHCSYHGEKKGKDSSEHEESGKDDGVTKSDNSNGEEESADQSLVATTQPALESVPMPNLSDVDATGVNSAESGKEPLQEATESALSALSALTLDTDGNGEKRGRSSNDNDGKDVDNTKKPRGGSLSASASRLVQNLRSVFENGGLRFVEEKVDGEPDVYLLVINGPNGKVPKSESQFGNNLSGFSLSPLRAVGVPETPPWIKNYWAPGSCISNVATQELIEANGFVKMTSKGGTFWSIKLREAEQRGIFMDAKDHSKWVLERAQLSADGAGVRVHSEGLRKSPTTFDGSWSDLNLPEMTDMEFDELAQAWLSTQEMASNRSAQRYSAIASMGADPYQVDLQPCMGSNLSIQVAEAMRFESLDSMETLLPLPAPNSAFDARIESLERLKGKPKPEPKEYDSFVDWHLSDAYASWSKRYHDDTYNWPKEIDVDSDDPRLGPPLKIPQELQDSFYITKTKAWEKNSRPGKWYKKRDDFIPTDKVQLTTRWAVQADDIDQQGFFKVDALEKMYKNMIVKGMVAFSVFDGTPDAPGKAIEFFPQRYVCQSVPWWNSKLKYLPLTMRLSQMGSGGFNKAERLENHLNLVAFSVVVEPEASMSWETLESNVRNHQQAVLESEEHEVVYPFFAEATLIDVQIVRELSLMTIVYRLADDEDIGDWELDKFCEDVNEKLRFPEAWVGHPVKEVVKQAKIISGPDISLFLPNLRLAYGLEDKSKIKRICNDADEWGLVLRTAFVDTDSVSHKTIEHALREVMLSSYAAANGFGPRIFAQWIVPEDAYHYEMRMNVGEICEHFADGMAEVERLDSISDGFSLDNYSIPSEPWCEKANWTNSGTRYNPFRVPLSREGADNAGLEWRKACTLMEGFEDNVRRLKTKQPFQDSLFMDALFEQCERMSQAGILHGDIKMENSVYRVWKHAPGDKDWNKITVRFIDFDPYFCKLVPFIPSEVLTLINFSLYMTSVTCYHKVPETGLSWRKLALEKIRPLLKEINKKYGNDASPVASAFRALRPAFQMFEVPQTMVGADGKENAIRQRFEEGWILYNDEWEAARMFRWNVAHYFETSCGGKYTNPQGGVRAPMIARLLSFIMDGDQYLAPHIWKNEEDPGAFRLPSKSGSGSDSESDSESDSSIFESLSESDDGSSSSVKD